MKGKHRVIVSTKRLKYEFELRRNLTIIQGGQCNWKNYARRYDSRFCEQSIGYTCGSDM